MSLYKRTLHVTKQGVTIGVLVRLGSFWIGGHWSAENKRLCFNPLPCFTIWITAPGGKNP